MTGVKRQRRRDRALKAMVRGVARVPWLVIGIGAAAAGFGLYLTATRLGYISDTNALIRPDAEFHQYYLDYREEFAVQEPYVVLVQGPVVERNRKCMADLAARCESSGMFRSLFWRLDFSGLEKRFLLYLPEADLREIESGIGRFLSLFAGSGAPELNLNAMLARANAMFDEEYLRKEESWDEFKPFVQQFAASLDSLAAQLESGGKATGPAPSLEGLFGAKGSIGDLERIKKENEYLGFDGGRTMLMLLTPSELDPEALSPHARNIAFVRQQIEELKPSYPDLFLGLTGEPVLEADQVESSMESVQRATFIVLGLIVALFFVSYKEVSRPMLAIVTLLMATFWTFGFATLAVGHLNIISNAFVAMILGLGIDFGIQLLGRYEEEISAGRGVLDALQESVAHTGNAIFTGAVTTAAAFYTMCYNEFVGLSELGVMAGTGVLLCMAGNLVVLPAFIWLRDRNRVNLAATAAPTHWRTGLLLREPLRDRPWAVIGCGAALSVAAVFGVMRLKEDPFDYNLLHLQNPKLESVRVEHRLLATKDAYSVIFAAVTAPDLEAARARAEELKALPSVRGVASLTDLIPTDQEKKLPIIGRIASRLRALDLGKDVSGQVDVARSRAELGKFLEQSREGAEQAKKFRSLSKRALEAEETFKALIPSLERALKALDGVSQEEAGLRLNSFQVAIFGELQKVLRWLAAQEWDRPIGIDDIPPQLRDRYLGKTGRVLIEVFPKEDAWEREPNVRFVRELRSVDPRVTGSPVQNFEYIEVLKRSFEQAAVYAMGVICVAVLLHFRHAALAALTLLPLGLGILWTLGLMPALGLRFSPANIITLPLVIGIGVAYGIYAVDRFREDASRPLFETSTGKSVWLSALTTMFGFGALIQASYRGISSLGLLMTIGVGMCLVSSLYFLPACLRVFGKRGRPPGGGASRPKGD